MPLLVEFALTTLKSALNAWNSFLLPLINGILVLLICGLCAHKNGHFRTQSGIEIGFCPLQSVNKTA
jgi:hypothetical protein